MPRMAKNDNTDDRLNPLRKRIDELDAQIVKMLNERAEVVVNIGQVKRDEQSPIYAPDREQRVLEQIRRFNTGPLPDSCFEAIWRELSEAIPRRRVDPVRLVQHAINGNTRLERFFNHGLINRFCLFHFHI